MSSEGVAMLKNFFRITFYAIQVCSLFQKNERNADNKIHCDVYTFILLIMLIAFLMKDNAMALLH